MLMEQLHDTHFWVLISTVVFAILAFVKGRQPLLAFLDARTRRIGHELADAERLRAEAQKLLLDIQKKHADAEKTAAQIVATAKETAIALQQTAEKKLQETLTRKEEQLMERISRAEAAAVQELRQQAADIAAKSAEILLHDALTKRGAKLVEEAIADIPAKLN